MTGDDTIRIDLVENGSKVEVELPDAVGRALIDTEFLDVRPMVRTRNRWSLTPRSKVGALAVPGAEVHIKPKVPISRVVFLLENSDARIKWRDDHVVVSEADDLLKAVVEAFERLTSQALQQGLMQGYRTVEESLPVVRGRIREADQLRGRYGMLLPVEVRYDDYSSDTPENRLLRAAVLVARRLPDLSANLRHRLLRLDARLADVTPKTYLHGRLEPWIPTRLNARLHPALRLAEVILRHTSFEPIDDGLVVTGFVVNMAKVFEDFVCVRLSERLRLVGGETRTQEHCYLDRDERIEMQPDLVWYRTGRQPSAVVDAKYKAEKRSGFPYADLYQMLAYCSGLGLRAGHLVYAKGNEDAVKHHIAQADITIWAHALDLHQPPAQILTDLDHLTAVIAADPDPDWRSVVDFSEETELLGD